MIFLQIFNILQFRVSEESIINGVGYPSENLPLPLTSPQTNPPQKID